MKAHRKVAPSQSGTQGLPVRQSAKTFHQIPIHFHERDGHNMPDARWEKASAECSAAVLGRTPKMAFRVLIIGGTGQVGAAVVRALAAEPSCAEVVMVNRKAISQTADLRVRGVILDTEAAQFPAEVTKLAHSMVAQGDPVYGASCVGVGKGSMKWSEEQLKALEIGVVGGFARGCQAGGITQFSLLSAAGSNTKSRIRYARVNGVKRRDG
jgi:hypothetical protein